MHQFEYSDGSYDEISGIATIDEAAFKVTGQQILADTKDGIRDRGLTEGAFVAIPRLAAAKVFSILAALAWKSVLLTDKAFAAALGLRPQALPGTNPVNYARKTAADWLSDFGFQPMTPVTSLAFFSNLLSKLGANPSDYLSTIRANFAMRYPTIQWEALVNPSALVQAINIVPTKALDLGGFLQAVLGGFTGLNWQQLCYVVAEMATSRAPIANVADGNIWAGYTAEELNSSTLIIVGQNFAKVQDQVIPTDAVGYVYNRNINGLVPVMVVRDITQEKFHIIHVDTGARFVGVIRDQILGTESFSTSLIGLEKCTLTGAITPKVIFEHCVAVVRTIAQENGNQKALNVLNSTIERFKQDGDLEKAVAVLDELAYAGTNEVTTTCDKGVLHRGMTANVVKAMMRLAVLPGNTVGNTGFVGTTAAAGNVR